MEKFNSVKTNNMEGWIKLHRKFIDWEWYDISEMVHLFIHLLLKANHETINWRGIEVKRGQLITGLKQLHEETNISIQTLRSCLKKLEKTGEINRQTNNRFSLITICNYDNYNRAIDEANKQPNKQLTSNQQATNKQLTTNKNVKNEKNEKNEKNNPNISLSKENNSLSKAIFVPSRDSEIDKFDTLNSIKPKLERTKGKALFDVPVQKKEEVSQEDKYLALATKLSEIIQTKKNIKHTKSQIQAWAKEFAGLERVNKVQYERQMTAMRWYEEHIGEPYVPVIESGSSFRKKFINLEEAIVRSENSNTQKTKNKCSLAHFDPEYNDILMRKATEKVTVL